MIFDVDLMENNQTQDYAIVVKVINKTLFNDLPTHHYRCVVISFPSYILDPTFHSPCSLAIISDLSLHLTLVTSDLRAEPFPSISAPLPVLMLSSSSSLTWVGADEYTRHLLYDKVHAHSHLHYIKTTLT